MQHRLEADPGKDLIMVTTDGDATVEGICAFLDDIISHPAWRPGMCILLDHRKLNLSPINQKGVEQVSDYFASISEALGNGKIALVMNKAVDFGITRSWEIITQDRTNMQIHVFRELDPARLWIEEQSLSQKLP
jgi:hypothetical protein